MEFVLDLQDMQAPDMEYGGGSGGGGGGGTPSNLSLLLSCAGSTISLLTCH